MLRALACAARLALLAANFAFDERAEESATIVVDSHLVVESVVVRDRDGKTMPGLGPADFTLTEDAVPQQIRLFRFEQPGDSSEGPPVPAQSPPHAASAAGRSAPPPLRYLVLYYDIPAMSLHARERAFRDSAKFIRTQLKAADAIAIMTFDGGSNFHSHCGFTQDRDRLLRCLQIARERALSASTFDGEEKPGGDAADDRDLAALAAAVRTLATIDAPKALVFFTGSPPREKNSGLTQLSAAVQAAVRSGVRLFPVDAEGLGARLPLGDATQGPPVAGMNIYSGKSVGTLVSRSQDAGDMLAALAKNTGGQAGAPDNDLSAAIVAAQRAIAAHYLIGYYSTNAATDGKARQIHIGLTGHPFARLEYRHGYATPSYQTPRTDSDLIGAPEAVDCGQLVPVDGELAVSALSFGTSDLNSAESSDASGPDAVHVHLAVCPGSVSTVAATAALYGETTRQWSGPITQFQSAGGATPIAIRIPLQGLTPGLHWVQVTVFDLGTERVAFRRIPIRIVP